MAAELAAQQGALHQNQGRLAEAARLYRRVLASPGVPTDVRVKIANNLGVLEGERGRPAGGAGLARPGRGGGAPGSGPAYVAHVAESRATVTVRAGRLPRGWRCSAAAARAWEAAGLPLGELQVESGRRAAGAAAAAGGVRAGDRGGRVPGPGRGAADGGGGAAAGRAAHPADGPGRGGRGGLCFAALAWRSAVRREFDEHRVWVMRLWLVVGGVWFFRVGFMFWLAFNQGPVGFDMRTFSGPAITILAFGQTLLPLALLQLYLHAERSGRPLVRYAIAAVIGGATVVMSLGLFAAANKMWLPHL